jgi:hypothetical protein
LHRGRREPTAHSIQRAPGENPRYNESSNRLVEPLCSQPAVRVAGIDVG